MSQLALRLDESTVEMLDLPIRSRMVWSAELVLLLWGSVEVIE